MYKNSVSYVFSSMIAPLLGSGRGFTKGLIRYLWFQFDSDDTVFAISKAVLLLWIIYVISVLSVICFRARLFIDALWSPAGKGLTSWLSFVMSNCDVVTLPTVSWVGCAASLYRFLIFALILTSTLLFVTQNRTSLSSQHDIINT